MLCFLILFPSCTNVNCEELHVLDPTPTLSKRKKKESRKKEVKYIICFSILLMLLVSNQFIGQLSDCQMEYDEEDNGVAGRIPEFGAIFMSSIVTKKECFKRSIFALPSSHAKFVKHVKAGMVLFLFEFEKRQLFGVFQASSDGAMDIVPHGFNYSGRHFPAQVPFTSIWSCNPLPEKEFRDAIRENYFSGKKFHFGLSEDQVRRLLYLFSSRKLPNRIPPHLPTEVAESASKDRGPVDNDNFALAERRYTKQSDYDEFNPAILCDYQGVSLSRAEEDEHLIEDGVYTEGKVNRFTERLNDYQDDFMTKRRRIDDENRLMRSDMEENAIYSNHGRLLLPVERVCNEDQLDKKFNHALSSEYMMGPLDVRMDIDHRLMQRKRLFKECDMDSGYGQSFAREHVEPLDRGKHESDDRFLFHDCARSNVRDIVTPNLNLRAAKEVTEDRHLSMNGMSENRYHMDSDGNPVGLRRIRTTAGGRLSTNEVIESERNLGSCAVAGHSSENFTRPLHCSHRITDDGKFPPASERETGNMLERIRGSTISKINSEYISSVDGRIIDDGRLRKSDFHAFVSPVISTEYPHNSNPKQNLSSFSDEYLPENSRSQLTIPRNFDPSGSKFNDATITRSVRYLSECPKFAYGSSTSLAADRISDLVRENHPHHGSLRNVYSTSSQFLESEKSGRYLDTTSGYENKGLPPKTSSHQSSLLRETPNSFLHSNSHMQMELNTSCPVDYRGSFLIKPSPYPENTELDNNFALDGDLPMASQRMSEHVPIHDMDILGDENFICSESKHNTLGVYHSERDLSGYEKSFRISSNMNLNKQLQFSEVPHLDSNAHRRSVFTRLTSGKEVHVGEERKDTHCNCHECYVDSSADEIMDMLLLGDTLPTRKPRKSRVAALPKHGKGDLDEKLTQSHVEINHSKMEKKKWMNDLASAEDIKEVPNETRIVDFKRRSQTKKNLVEANTFSDADNKITAVNGEIEISTNLVEANTFPGAVDNKINAVDEEVEISTKKNLKRKKLVRPVFKKDELATDSTVNSQHLQLLGQILHKDYKQTCQSAINTCEAKMRNESTMLSNVLSSGSHQCMNFNVKEHSYAGVQKDIEAHVTLSTGDELEGHKTSNVDVENGASQVLEGTTQSKGFVTQTSVNGHKTSNLGVETGDAQVLKETTQSKGFVTQTSVNEEHNTLNVGVEAGASQVLLKETTQSKGFVSQASVDEGHKTSNVGVEAGASQVLLKETTQSKSFVIQASVNGHKTSSVNEGHKTSNVGVETGASQVLLKETTQSTGFVTEASVNEGHKTSNVGVETGTSQVLLKETTRSRGFVTESFVKDFGTKDVDASVGKLNMKESSEGPKLDNNCGNNSGEGKRFRMSKNKKKITRLGKQ